MTRLREAVGPVELIDARSGHPLVQEIKDSGIDLNEGMLARYGDQDYFGADCMNLLAVLTNRTTFIGKTLSWLFSNREVARRLYPFLRAGRNAVLATMGRSRIP
jgi:hypothetical protein